MHKCQLVYVILNNLSEAFQFFDSQNARGKELEPYDLLKAFHLREMAKNSEQDRINCVSAWENEVSPDDKTINLHTIMSNILFRIRRWAVGQSGTNFNRHNIDVFKGVNLQGKLYRFTESLRALDYMVDQYNEDSIRHWDQQKMPYPFLVDQTILNGKRFFEYIQHYIHIYQILFIDKKSELKDILQTINNYEGRNRTGDHYIRNLFYCTIIYYYDKFGDVELKKAGEICFIWSYRIRLEQNRVVIESIDNEARHDLGLFHTIKQALHPHDVLSYKIKPMPDKINGTKVDELITMFNKLGY